ncbi:MAG: hypothetical protein PHI79_08210 [Sulfurovaceae bacterium]|jgi:hypothetical protein|nr:hypothetical protein [Sulfurovaceae bacterium]
MKSKQQKREEARERQEKHDKLSVNEKIDKAVSRPGFSWRELDRLMAIQEANHE